jgi:hypothetical protein
MNFARGLVLLFEGAKIRLQTFLSPFGKIQEPRYVYQGFFRSSKKQDVSIKIFCGRIVIG